MDANYRAVWVHEGSELYNISGDTKIDFNRSFVPNKDRQIVPFTYYDPKPDMNITVNNRKMDPVGPRWDNDFEITWNVVLSAGEKRMHKFGGLIRCDICMMFSDFVNIEFDLARSWKFNIASTALNLVGGLMARYYMPSHASGVFRMVLIQSYELAKLVGDNYPFVVTVQASALRTNIADGKLQPNDTLRGDMSVEVEEDWGRISVKGFD